MPIKNYVATELEKIKKSFLWANSTSKIKHFGMITKIVG